MEACLGTSGAAALSTLTPTAASRHLPTPFFLKCNKSFIVNYMVKKVFFGKLVPVMVKGHPGMSSSWLKHTHAAPHGCPTHRMCRGAT